MRVQFLQWLFVLGVSGFSITPNISLLDNVKRYAHTLANLSKDGSVIRRFANVHTNYEENRHCGALSGLRDRGPNSNCGDEAGGCRCTDDAEYCPEVYENWLDDVVIDGGQRVPIDIVIPLDAFSAHNKELIEEYIIHAAQMIEGVHAIYIVSQFDPKLSPKAVEGFELPKLYFVSEKKFPFWADIRETGGWRRRQMIKMYMFQAIPTLLNHTLVLESDVIWLRPTSFVVPVHHAFKTKPRETLVSVSSFQPDSCNKERQRMVKDLLGYAVPRSNGLYSPVTSAMLYERDKMQRMLYHIRKRDNFNRSVVKIIEDFDPHGNSSKATRFSEYELYFAWLFREYREEIRIVAVPTVRFQGTCSVKDILKYSDVTGHPVYMRCDHTAMRGHSGYCDHCSQFGRSTTLKYRRLQLRQFPTHVMPHA